MNMDWFLKTPNRVWVLGILLALALVVAVTCKPFIRWFKCESMDRFMAMEPDDDPTGVWYDFGKVWRAPSPEWTPDGSHIVFVTPYSNQGNSTPIKATQGMTANPQASYT